jgi:hypothetical protein
MASKISYRDWYIPLAEDDITLAQALDFLRVVGAPAQKIPLIIQIMENPKFNIGGKTLFPGAVTLHQHDCIPRMRPSRLASRWAARMRYQPPKKICSR